MAEGPAPGMSGISRGEALRTLIELADGVFAERMRREAAARIIAAARLLAQMPAASGARLTPLGHGLVESVSAGWDSQTMPLERFVEMLTPRTLAALLEEAPRWAEAVAAAAEAAERP